MLASVRPGVVLLLLASGACLTGDTEPETDLDTAFRYGPAPTSNNCGDPGWADTLRCDDLAISGSAAAPQQNWGTAPANVAGLENFTRVFLPIDDEIRCYDGTIPTIYVDAADPPSDDWLISFTGGGSCVPREGATPGVIDDAQDCTEAYLAEKNEMSSAFDPPMKNFLGINRPSPIQNPVFSGYNRVRIEKCSYDRFNGQAIFDDVEATIGPTSVVYDAYQQGRGIAEAALEELRAGLTYTTWEPSGVGDEVQAVVETLPALESADKVLLMGHSGGAHGLMHNVDALADQIRGMACVGCEIDVRAAFDANMTPSLENEAFYAEDLGGLPLEGDLFSGHQAGVSLADGVFAGTPFAYDMAAKYTDPSDPYVAAYANWNADFDDSCEAAHTATGDTWICQDRFHVLFNHVDLPIFIRQDFSDPNGGHTMGGTGFAVTWAEEETDPALCGWFGAAPCPPLMSAAQYAERLGDQAATLISGYWSNWEGAASDPGISPTDRPTMYLWMPDCESHAGAYANDSFYDTEITYKTFTHSMRQWMEGFMNVDPRNRKGWRVDGWSDGVNTMMTDCPGP